jgi:hypothetical protein
MNKTAIAESAFVVALAIGGGYAGYRVGEIINSPAADSFETAQQPEAVYYDEMHYDSDEKFIATYLGIAISLFVSGGLVVVQKEINYRKTREDETLML